MGQRFHFVDSFSGARFVQPGRREKVLRMVANALNNKAGVLIVDGVDIKHSVEGDKLSFSVHCALNTDDAQHLVNLAGFLRQIVDLVQRMEPTELDSL